jgi:hypothetical protein
MSIAVGVCPVGPPAATSRSFEARLGGGTEICPDRPHAEEVELTGRVMRWGDARGAQARLPVHGPGFSGL